MKFVQGQKVWVVERDEIEEPDAVSGVVFISEVGGVALVHSSLGGCRELDAILHYCLEETRENFSCNIQAYPIEDCYESFDDAEEAMNGEQS